MVAVDGAAEDELAGVWRCVRDDSEKWPGGDDDNGKPCDSPHAKCREWIRLTDDGLDGSCTSRGHP